MSRKKKFDLTHLIHDGSLKDGQTLLYVSDPTIKCQIIRQVNGEFKVTNGTETMTIHAFATKCLGQEPPDHAAKWLRTENGQSLYDLWHSGDMSDEEAA